MFLCDPRHWQLEIEFPYLKSEDTEPVLCSVLVLEIIMEKDILHPQRLHMSVSRRVTGPVSVSISLTCEWPHSQGCRAGFVLRDEARTWNPGRIHAPAHLLTAIPRFLTRAPFLPYDSRARDPFPHLWSLLLELAVPTHHHEDQRAA